MSTLSYRPVDYKAAVACWPITRAIGRQLEKQLKLLLVFNKGKSAIFSTVNGDVYSLGLNPSGALGTGQNQICNAPTKITGIKQAPVGVAVGVYSDSGQSVIAFTEKGTVYSWGYNSSGCLGLQNNSNSPILAPSPIQKGLEGFRITQVSCGRLFSLALSSNGEVFSWGTNGNGQLGNNSTNDSSIPIKVNGELMKLQCTHISCGYYTSYALTKEGNIYSWGYNSHGELGIGNSNSGYYCPQLVQLQVQTVFTSIAAGRNHVLAVDDCGHLYAWGYNGHGELGDGTSNNRYTPVHKPDKTYNFVEVAAHHEQNISAATNASGKVYVWGEIPQLQNDDKTPTETNLQSLDEVFSVYGDGTMYRALKIESDPSSVSSTIKLQLNNQDTSDVEFVVEGKSIHAHKTILVLRCEHFKTMFTGDYKESTTKKIETISFSYEVFNAFIVYLYTDEIHIKLEHVEGLLDLSEQYNECALKVKLENLIRTELTTDNVAKFFSIADKFNAKNLMDYCVKYIAGHMKLVLRSQGFREMDPVVLRKLMTSLAPYDVFKT